MVNILSRSLCENCFAEIDSEPCPECGYSRSTYEQDRSVLPIGSVLEGRYMIGRVLGKGGFGITYLAYDMKLDCKVAIKEYYPLGAAVRDIEGITVSAHSEETKESFISGAEKFYSEARLVAGLSGNPNIVNVSDVFRENETVYFTMGYLEGRTLKSYIAKYGKISEEQAVYIAGEVSNALVSAHKKNVLHRDISPDNIMVCTDGTVKLLDFGAARQVFTEQSSSLSVILKQGYAPLEQYQKKGKQGPWTDIYSLGATLYYSLTLDLLEDPMSRMDDDEEFNSNSHDISTALWEIIKKATMLRTSERYQDIYELLDALDDSGIVPRALVKTDRTSDRSFGSVERRRIDLAGPEAVSPAMEATVALKENTDMNATVALEPDMDVTMPLGGNAVSDMNVTVPLNEKNSQGMNSTAALKNEEITDMNVTAALNDNAASRTGQNADNIMEQQKIQKAAKQKKRSKLGMIITTSIFAVFVIYVFYIIVIPRYKYEISDDGATITGYSGMFPDITIPSELGGKPVVCIGDKAFYIVSGIKNVTIPDGVERIGEDAFNTCYRLESITIPDSVTEIGDNAFWYCEELESITIPDSVKKIGSSAFNNCDSLKIVSLSDSLTKIDTWTFAYCSSLESVTIPDSVKEISFDAFYNCTNLKTVSLPAGCKVADSAFEGCDNVQLTYR